LSLEARLIQGLRATAEEVVREPAVEPALAVVLQRVDRPRSQQRLVLVAAAVAAILALVIGPKVGDFLMGLEPIIPPSRQDGTERDLRYPDDATLEDNWGPLPDEGDDRQGLIVGLAPEEETPRTSGSSSGAPPSRNDGPVRQTEPAPVAAAPRDKPARRSVSAAYSAADGVAARTGTASCDGGDGSACFVFPVRAGERFVSVTIQDDSGAPVFAWLQQDRDGDGAADGEWQGFCGASPAMRLGTGAVVRVLLDVGTCDDEASSPSQGTITATFSRYI
jgi:hypothetical protein